MISVKNSYEIAYNGTENECRFELYADTAADLQGLTHIDGIKIQMGSECTDISTGDKYILNGSGVWVLQPSANEFANVYTKVEIDSMITEINGVIAYYHTVIVSDTGEITFYSLGGNVGKLSIYGNGRQTGTPAPDNPVMPEFVGTLSDSDWTIPITCAGQTTPVYLGQTQTVRRVRKLVLTGEETFSAYDATYNRVALVVSDWIQLGVRQSPLCCSHYQAIYDGRAIADVPDNSVYSDGRNTRRMFFKTTDYTDVTDFKQYLAAQYAAGTPVTVWYVLAEPETGIVNEPLAKIGTYADELHSEDAGVSIPTAKGSNTLTVDTTLKPSKIEISGER